MIKNILNNNKVVNAFNILVIAPILYLVANDKSQIYIYSMRARLSKGCQL